MERSLTNLGECAVVWTFAIALGTVSRSAVVFGCTVGIFITTVATLAMPAMVLAMPAMPVASVMPVPMMMMMFFPLEIVRYRLNLSAYYTPAVAVIQDV